MTLTLAIPKETYPGEKRTALVPSLIKKIQRTRTQHRYRIEHG